MEYEIEIRDWRGNQFNNRFKTVYTGEKISFAPQFIINGKDQTKPNCGFWIRYYLFDEDTTHILACAITGPRESDHQVDSVGQTILYRDIFERENAYDENGNTPNTVRTGYEIFASDESGNLDLSQKIGSDGSYQWDGWPNISEGIMDTPLELIPQDEESIEVITNPFDVTISPSRPTVTFIGNTTNVPYNGDEHTASGYELYYVNDTNNAFKTALEEQKIQIIAEPPQVSGTDPGVYETNLVPEDFEVINVDGGIYYNINFQPAFKISKQIRLIIGSGEETSQSGIGIPVSVTKVYDGTPLCPRVENNLHGIGVYYSEDGIVFGTDPVSITDVGTKYVTVKITGLPGYDTDYYGYYSITISPRPIYINSDSMSWNYTGNMCICDRFTIQGHINDNSEEQISGKTYYTEEDPEYNAEAREFQGIPLLNEDRIHIKFKGGQAEIGSSDNAFDFQLESEKPTNYDVRIVFGLLKVNLNTQDIYVFIRGNTKGMSVAYPEYEDWEKESDRECLYNGGIWSVSGYEVIGVSDDPEFIPTPGDRGNLWNVYSAKDVDFIGKTTDSEVSGIYINNITDSENPDFWNSIVYESNLTDQNFKNNNSNFSSRNIQFIVTPNQLLITKRPVDVNIQGHTLTKTFNMIKDEEDEFYRPEWFSVEGCDYLVKDLVYDIKDIIYHKINPNDGKPLNTPVSYGCVVCEDNEDPEDPKWYMHLEEDIHDSVSDKSEQFEDGFINKNKNFEVSFFIAKDDSDRDLDGWLWIKPLDVNLYLRGSIESTIYNGQTQFINGTFSKPEIWWRSDCKFFNQYSSKSEEDTRLFVETIEESDKKIENSDSREESRENTTLTETEPKIDKTIIARIEYYRTYHNQGHFEWDGNEGYVEGIDINDKSYEESEYWDPIPYPMNLEIDDFRKTGESDDPTQFTQFDREWSPVFLYGDQNHIYKNFDISFDLIADGSLTIYPYSDPVKVDIYGNHDTRSYSGGEETVVGYNPPIISDTSLYNTNINDNIIQPEDTPTVSGTEPGTYIMGLTVLDFANKNHNFSNVLFFVTDGWLVIEEKPIQQDVTGKDSYNKVFDNTALEVLDPQGGTNLKRYSSNPDYDPKDPLSEQWIYKDSLNFWDVGNTDFKIASDKEDSDTSIQGTASIEPLRLHITSRSKAFLYDGSPHNEQHVDINILNSGLSDINRANIENFLPRIIYKNWASIEDIGSIPNSFEIDRIEFDANVGNPVYSVNGRMYSETELSRDMVPNVIITTSFGSLTVSKGVGNLIITGNTETIIYDGLEHSLTGFTASLDGEPIDVFLKSSFHYESSMNKRDIGEYPIGFNASDFDLPEDVLSNTTVIDGQLSIIRRNLIIRTGSDTRHWDDDENPIAENHSLYIFGLANTDTIPNNISWPVLQSAGSISNEISYNIIHRSGDDVKNNYDITEEWGTLEILQASQSDMYYRILGIRKSVTTPETDKVHITGMKRIDGSIRMVDEDRFYPILHKLTRIPENGMVDADDVICIIPMLKHSSKIEEVTWMFENKSTGETIFSKVHNRPISPTGDYAGIWPEYKHLGGLADTPILNVIPKTLSPGYYDITVNFVLDKKMYSQKFSSVFMIKKSI